MNNIKRTYISIGTIGDSQVGKSAMTEIYLNREFSEEYLTTIGININTKDTKIIINGEEKEIKVKIWDTAGQEKFKSISTQYIKNCDGILLIYAINNKKTFENIENWLNEIENKKKKNNIPLVLIGNKIDLEKEREVSFQEGEKLAQIYNMEFFECSAKDKINVNECFNCLIELIFQLYEDEFNIDDKSYSLFDNGAMNTSNCCLKKKK